MKKGKNNFNEKKNNFVNWLLTTKDLIYGNYDILGEDKFKNIQDSYCLRILTVTIVGLVGLAMTGAVIPTAIFLSISFLITGGTSMHTYLKVKKQKNDISNNDKVLNTEVTEEKNDSEKTELYKNNYSLQHNLKDLNQGLNYSKSDADKPAIRIRRK